MGDVRSFPGFPPGRSLTRTDLEAMPHDGHRYELVDGVLVVSPSPRPLHQRAIARLMGVLEPSCPSAHEVLPAPVDVVLADDCVLIPDVVVGRREDFTEQALVGPPLLAIEVLSPRTKHFDLELKRAKFAEAGCPHYWVVDPNEPHVRCWALDGGEDYVEIASVSGEQPLQLTEPFSILLRPADLVSPFKA
jgi:Uma2 family endonuclease